LSEKEEEKAAVGLERLAFHREEKAGFFRAYKPSNGAPEKILAEREKT